MKIFIILAIIITFWLLCNLTLLLYRNSRALNLFKKLELLLNKRYEILSKIGVPQEAEKYLIELRELPKGVKFLNRKLALNYILSGIVNSVYTDKEFPNEYKIINFELTNLGNIYNSSAIKLKISVEIFPTALMARFLNIKTVDFYRG